MPKNVSEALREPPYSVGYEQAVLAACMLEGGQECVARATELKLSPSSFYIPAHQEIFKICQDLFSDRKLVNVLTVGERLRVDGRLERIGGYPYLNAITDRIQSPAGFEEYAKEVKNLEIARKLEHFFLSALENVYSATKNIDQFLGDVESRVLEINRDRVVDTALPFKIPLERASTTIQKLFANKGNRTGVRSGFKQLDEMTDGFHGGEMIVLAARPSMGKTALALNIAEHAAVDDNVSTLFFSLEMSAEQLAMRMVCSHGRLNMIKIRDGYGNSDLQKKVFAETKVLEKIPLWIDETSNLTILEMRSKARRLYAQKALGLVVIDYLQLLSGTDSHLPREQQIAEISRGIKGMAKELNIPVIVLSQLNRESEKEYRKPLLSDLRESGSIEQDADLVLLLSKTRESIKALKEGQNDPDDSDVHNSDDKGDNDPVKTVSLIVAKQRNGPTDDMLLKYHKAWMRFEDNNKRE